MHWYLSRDISLKNQSMLTLNGYVLALWGLGKRGYVVYFWVFFFFFLNYGSCELGWGGVGWVGWSEGGEGVFFFLVVKLCWIKNKFSVPNKFGVTNKIWKHGTKNYNMKASLVLHSQVTKDYNSNENELSFHSNFVNSLYQILPW